MPTNVYDLGLDKNAANYAPMTPLSFLERSAAVYPHRVAIVHGPLRRTWSETYARCRRLASALQKLGIGRGDTVAAMMPNTPAMVEAQFGVPMSGAVLAALNTRLDAEALSFMLGHGEAKVVLVDREFAGTLRTAVRMSGRELTIVDVDDPEYRGPGDRVGTLEYEALLASGDPQFAWPRPTDEWDAIALNYTSGTTGDPKGVVFHHRGAYLAAVSSILEWDMPTHPVYLWTVPLFHCNGWCFAWAVAARAGVNVCLRKIDAPLILELMREHRVTHYCGAPIVHNMLVSASSEHKRGLPTGIRAFIAGAAPPAALIEGLEVMGFDITHVYGLTEVYGPASVCAKQAEWSTLPIGERSRLNARQGVRYHLQEAVAVLDPETMRRVPDDGATMGEIMFRGNMTMKGYLKNPRATAEAFAGGWFHTGDLGVSSPEDGYVKIKDRSKDIIISGGENISSVEVEDVLYRHPAVLMAAVVAKPDPRWGETPCAFIALRPGMTTTAAEIIAHCRTHLAGFKIPRAVEFGDLPTTSTGKIQKFELRKRVGSVAAIDV